MNLAQAHREYGWPKQDDILSPKGEGPQVIAQNVISKIERNLKALSENGQEILPQTGVLFASHETDRTDVPLAIVCEFSQHVTPETLLLAHKLAWNFAKAPLLITLEPSRVLAWSCSVRPTLNPDATLEKKTAGKIVSRDITRRDDPLDCGNQPELGLQDSAAELLHWVNLLAGTHFQKRPQSFKESERLDATLIKNLQCVRDELRDNLHLPESRCHDLLARLIFIQFLFQRKDSEGRAAINSNKLRKLQEERVLKNAHSSLGTLLSDYNDAYAFFKWLNEHFNGDLFPGKAATPQDREREWRDEQADVKPEHLKLLASFVSGNVEFSTGQYSLWTLYAFDIIPLELISSIYEIFVGPPEETKSYYTKGHLVDFMLDAVLPWNGKESALRVLDPACGSGIFLVKAFQRLAHRYKKENGGKLKPSDLKNILKRQIFGVDINREAVRVASFSLYLAMCDELDPRQYWSKEKLFPLMRDENLLVGRDFFCEDTAPIRTKEDAGTFDLIIGNAPWGKSSAASPTDAVHAWAKNFDWKVPGKDLGPVFLAKAARLAKPNGWVSMIQSSGLLLNRSGPAKTFRTRLLSSVKLEEVINLAAIRRALFASAIGPACIVTFSPETPEGKNDFAYVTPKLQGSEEDRLKIVIEPHDIHFIQQKEAATDDIVWSVLMWGGRRDLELIRRLMKHESLGKLMEQGVIASREGVIRGNRKKTQKEIVGRKFLHEREFPKTSFFELDSNSLDTNVDPDTDSAASTDFTAFESPQLLFKQSWRAAMNRFQAVLVKPDNKGHGALCSDSYVSVRDLTGKYNILAGLWLLLNSNFAPYWFQLTGGKFAGFVPVATETELRRMPVFSISKTEAESIARKQYSAIDAEIIARLQLNEAEKILIEDLYNVVLPDTQVKKGTSPGRKSVTKTQLREYADAFLKVLQATFGNSKRVGITLFESQNQSIPLQLIAVQMRGGKDAAIQEQAIQSDELLAQLKRCEQQFFQASDKEISFQRVIEALDERCTPTGKKYTLYLVRPNQRRYWLRSLALRDADRLGALINRLGGHTRK